MKTDSNVAYELTQQQREFAAKLARIAELAERNGAPEFGGSFFRRKLAEMMNRKGN